MNPVPPHFIIEEGPERGREIIIPAEGARIGRADENDIQIADATMSRFQCRAYFKDKFLHVMDLGSTNATVVNDVEIADSPLRHGDHVIIGESLLRVVNDGLSSAPAIPPPLVPGLERIPGEGAMDSVEIQFQPSVTPPAAPPLAPASRENVSAPPPPAVDSSYDLFGKKTPANGEGKGDAPKRSLLPMILVALVTLLVVVGAMAVMVMSAPVTSKPVVSANDQSVQVYFEKILGDTENIFRYALTLENGVLTAEIHDLVNQRAFERSETLTEKELKELLEELTDQYLNFRKLQTAYEGASAQRHEVYDLTVILGRKAHRVRVQNQLEPATFKDVRDLVEAVADSKLGLSTIQQPVEVLRARANLAWEVGNDLFDRKNVQDDNLWQAIKKMREIAWLVESIEPKPDYYRQAVKQQHDWSEALEAQRKELWFAAQREARINNYPEAIDYLTQLMAARPDSEDDLWKKAKKSKVQLEQLIN